MAVNLLMIRQPDWWLDSLMFALNSCLTSWQHRGNLENDAIWEGKCQSRKGNLTQARPVSFAERVCLDEAQIDV